jgi:hypothetical protein
MSAKRQKNQLMLAFAEEGRSETPKASREGTESLTAKCETERPASHEQLMEEICERENCWQAYKRGKANKGSPGIDGMKVGELSDYLKQHWPRMMVAGWSRTFWRWLSLAHVGGCSVAKRAGAAVAYQDADEVAICSEREKEQIGEQRHRPCKELKKREQEADGLSVMSPDNPERNHRQIHEKIYFGLPLPGLEHVTEIDRHSRNSPNFGD